MLSLSLNELKFYDNDDNELGRVLHTVKFIIDDIGRDFNLHICAIKRNCKRLIHWCWMLTQS